MQILLLHQQILLQTERLRELHRSLMLHTSAIPSEEMESLLQEIRTLYNLALQLNNDNALKLLNDVQLAVANSVQKNPTPVQSTPEPSLNGASHAEIVTEKSIVEKVSESPMQAVTKSETVVADSNRFYGRRHHRSPAVAK